VEILTDYIMHCLLSDSQSIVHKYKCTMDQELADAAAYAPGRRWCALTR